MALTTPIVFPIPAFDATIDNKITFTSIGGDQVVKNKIIIKLNSDNSIVYENIVSSFLFEQVVPANTLLNGGDYTAQFQTFNSLDEESAISSAVQFRCYSTPVLECVNIPDNGIIQQSIYEFDFSYFQEQGEKLDSYTVNLYDTSDALVSTSGVKYTGGSSTNPFIFTYKFEGFVHNDTYKIECVGITSEDTIVKTIKYEFTVQYYRPSLFAVVQLENNKCDGYISITSNLVNIEGTSVPDPPIYQDSGLSGDKDVDVSGDGHYVLWDNGFEVDGDFTLEAWGKNFNEFTNIIKVGVNVVDPFNYEDIDISYNYEIGQDGNKYTYLMATVGSNYTPSEKYVVYSNFIDYIETEKYIHIWLRRIDNLYEIKIASMEGVTV